MVNQTIYSVLGMNLVNVQVAQQSKSCPVALAELMQIMGINNNILKQGQDMVLIDFSDDTFLESIDMC